jgi:hypothetical protein
VNWEAVGAIAEILGAIGVILSLAYLSVQIRSNTKQLRFSASQSVAEALDRAFDPIYTEPCLSIWQKGHNGIDDLTEAERTVFNGLMARQSHNYANVLDAQNSNLIERGRAGERYRQFYADLFATPGGIRWLEEHPNIAADIDMVRSIAGDA